MNQLNSNLSSAMAAGSAGNGTDPETEIRFRKDLAMLYGCSKQMSKSRKTVLFRFCTCILYSLHIYSYLEWMSLQRAHKALAAKALSDYCRPHPQRRAPPTAYMLCVLFEEEAQTSSFTLSIKLLHFFNNFNVTLWALHIYVCTLLQEKG